MSNQIFTNFQQLILHTRSSRRLVSLCPLSEPRGAAGGRAVARTGAAGQERPAAVPAQLDSLSGMVDEGQHERAQRVAPGQPGLCATLVTAWHGRDPPEGVPREREEPAGDLLCADGGDCDLHELSRDGHLAAAAGGDLPQGEERTLVPGAHDTGGHPEVPAPRLIAPFNLGCRLMIECLIETIQRTSNRMLTINEHAR